MSTHSITIAKNGWTQIAFDGTKVSTPNQDTLPADMWPGSLFNYPTASASPFLANPLFPNIVFTFVFNSAEGGGGWQQKAPTESGENWTFSYTYQGSAGYAYPLIIDAGTFVGTCPFPINYDAIETDEDMNPFFSSTLFLGDYELNRLFNDASGDVTNILPDGTKTLFPYVIDGRNSASSGDAITVDLSRFLQTSVRDIVNVIFVAVNETKSGSYETVVNSNANRSIFIVNNTSKRIILSNVGINPSKLTIDITDSTNDKLVIDNYVAIAQGGSVVINGASTSNTVSINNHVQQPTGFTAPSGDGITWSNKYSSELDRIASTVLNRTGHVQSVQTNLQTIINQIESTMVNVTDINSVTHQYVAIGDIADTVWQRFRDVMADVFTANVSTSTATTHNEPATLELVGEDGLIDDSSRTITNDIVLTIPREDVSKNITAIISDKEYQLFVNDGHSYHPVMSSLSGIIVKESSWDILTEGSVTFALGKLCFNSVTQSICSEWTQDDLKHVDENIAKKTAVIIDGKAFPLISFTNVQPSFVLIHPDDGVEI